MQTVIDITDDIYAELTKTGENEINLGILLALREAVRQGTTLPKGHGRLIDADAYIDKHEECGWLDDITVDEFNAITPTIIEADKEPEE